METLAHAPACRHCRIRVAALLARIVPEHGCYRHDDMAARTVNLSVLVLGTGAP